jgi:zinc transport system substrate-binding protein
MNGLRTCGAAMLAAVLAATAVAAGCGGRGPAPSGLPIAVTVAVPPQAWLVERIGGERVEVTVMVPPGAAPDGYEPTPHQVLALGGSRLYVAVGHAAFPFERDYLAAVARPELEVVDMAAGVEPLAAGPRTGSRTGPRTGRGSAELDPHVWLSPTAMAAAARGVAAALERIDPEGAATYRAGRDRVLAEIAALDRDLRATLAGVRGRRFLVYHPAWGYFAAEYGLVQTAIERGGKDPGPAELAGLVESARREGISTVFVQSGFSDRAARVIAAQIGAEVVAVDPLARDWPDNLRRVAAAFRRAMATEADPIEPAGAAEPAGAGPAEPEPTTAGETAP